MRLDDWRWPLEHVDLGVVPIHTGAEPLQELAKAQWSRSYVNDLPDSAFLYIEPTGEKDDGGRTTPRSLRHFPVRSHRDEADVPQDAHPRGARGPPVAKAKPPLRRLVQGAEGG